MPSHPDNAAPGRQALDRSAFSGIAWSGAAKWSTQLVAWAGTIVVARILTPSDYGLLTMAGAFIGVVYLFSEFGVGTAVVTIRELSVDEVRQLNALSLILGVGCTLFTGIVAYPLGRFFRAPELPAVLVVVGVTFVISSLQAVPAALLRRELRFRTIAVIDVARGLSVPIVTLIGALLGLRYWALAIGSIVGAGVTALLTLSFRRVAFAWPRMTELKHALRFSRHILGSRLASVVYQDGDFAVAGRRLGSASLGDYSIAWTIATAPIEKVVMVLSDVIPSLFSAVQDDRPALRRYFLNLSELLCVATFPASVGLALVSHDLVPVLLGNKWVGAATPLALLALSTGPRSVSSLFAHVYVVSRETSFSMWIAVIGAILMLAGFIVGSAWGTTGIAAAWLIIHPAVAAYSFGRVRRLLALSPADYLRTLRLGLDGVVAMAVVVICFQHFIAASWVVGLRLVISILLGATVYGLTTWLVHRERLRQIVDWARKIRSGGVAKSV